MREALNVESLEGMVQALCGPSWLMTLLVRGHRRGGSASRSFARDHIAAAGGLAAAFSTRSLPLTTQGFDALGGGHSLIPYRNDLLAEPRHRCARSSVGGIGFMVILDVGRCRGQFRRMTFHTKVVLSTTAVLLVGGAVLLQLTEPHGLAGGAFPEHDGPHGGLFHAWI